jgi:hypothetical protein
LPEHFIYKGGLAVIDVRDNGNVSNILRVFHSFESYPNRGSYCSHGRNAAPLGIS